MVIFKSSGSLLDDPATIRVNTVNCVGVMGKGVALAFAKRFPYLELAYKEDCKRDLYWPGCARIYHTMQGDAPEFTVNIATKDHWRNPSRYEWIDHGILNLRTIIETTAEILDGEKVSVVMPALGCGNGGLNWDKVQNFIVDHLDGLSQEVAVFEPGKGF